MVGGDAGQLLEAGVYLAVALSSAEQFAGDRAQADDDRDHDGRPCRAHWKIPAAWSRLMVEFRVAMTAARVALPDSG